MPAHKSSDDGRERLHKRIAASGLCSRRAAEQLIAEGRVEVNGATISEQGVKVGPGDEVSVDGQVVFTQKHYYVLMNKPTGYVTTMRDPQGRPTVARLLPDMGVTLKPVGRLDMDTEGLLIFTNDGEFANRLAHPRYQIEKEYQAFVEGKPDDKALKKLREGIHIEGRRTAPADATLVRYQENRNQSELRLVLHEGRKRQVRLMCESVGHPVLSLKRVRIGSLRLKHMRKGECRLLSKSEVDELKRGLGL